MLEQAVQNCFWNAAQSMQLAAMEQQRPFMLLRPSMFPDGNQWCALYGDDLQQGVAGFGDTPAEAAANFDLNWSTQKAGPAAGVTAAPAPSLPRTLSPKMQTALFHGLGISGTECVQRYRAMLDAAGVAAGVASASGSAPGVPVVLRNHHPNCAYATLPDQPTNCSCPPIDGVPPSHGGQP